MNDNNAAKPVLTDDEIRQIADKTGAHCEGWDGAQWDLALSRAIESALLSKLRAEGAPVGSDPLATEEAFQAWADRFPEISDMVRLRDAWNTAPVASAPADERISLRGAANLAFNALHECKPAKGAEKQYSDAIQALQSALHDIAYTINRTATPQQFADHLQREARAALASAPVAGEAPVATLHDDGYYTWHGAKPHGYDRAGWRMKVYAAPQASEAVRNAGVELAAAWVEKRRHDFDHEHGYMESGTGAWSFGTGAHATAKAEYSAELDEIAEGIRALKQPQADKDGGQQRAVFDHPVFAFLLGEGQLRGVDFGERAPGAVGKWWWRKDLRAALSANQTGQGERDA